MLRDRPKAVLQGDGKHVIDQEEHNALGITGARMAAAR